MAKNQLFLWRLVKKRIKNEWMKDGFFILQNSTKSTYASLKAKRKKMLNKCFLNEMHQYSEVSFISIFSKPRLQTLQFLLHWLKDPISRGNKLFIRWYKLSHPRFPIKNKPQFHYQFYCNFLNELFAFFNPLFQ